MKSDNVDFEDAAAQYQVLVGKIATVICQHGRVTRDMPTTAELKNADARARSIIADVSKWIYQNEGRR